MPSIPYNFIVSELNLPTSISYEFRTKNDVLYSCFFIQSSFNPSYDEETKPFETYEFGLTDIIENTRAREIDINIKATVVEIIRQFLTRFGSDFLTLCTMIIQIKKRIKET